MVIVDPNLKEKVKNYQPLVLIVDNDRDNLLLASCIVKLLGMRYVVTDKSEECLQLIEEFLPDLILLDIVMPNVNGLEIAQIIKENPQFAYIPIIAVTGLAKTEEKSQIIAMGCDDYLIKPYLIEQLEAKIYRFLPHLA